MPPRKFSRYTFCTGVSDDVGRLLLTEREPYRFQNFPDNIRHVVRAGDTLWGLASYHYAGISDRPAGLWWIIADFQPQPIVDPTIRLTPGRLLILPSRRTVLEEVFSDRRRLESNVL